MTSPIRIILNAAAVLAGITLLLAASPAHAAAKLPTGPRAPRAPRASHSSDQQWSKTYQLTGRADLHVTTDDGDVSLVSGNVNEIYALVTATGNYKIGPSDVRVEESQSGNHVELNVRLPHFSMHLFNHGGVKVEVHVPAEADIDVHTGDGNVNLQPVSGRIHIDTGDGNVNANGVKGDVRVHTGDGHIEGTDFDGSFAGDTGDGHITVMGRFDTLTLKTGDGHIDATARAGSKVVSSWMLHSGDGRINLQLPDDFHADLDAHTGDGHITLDIPCSVSGTLNHSSIHGKLNGGGGQLTITSGDGSIHVSRL
jgi:hypothetical protein